PSRVGLELLAQPRDGHRDHAAVAERAPDKLEQLVAAEDLPRMLDQHAEQRELSWRQLDLASLASDLVRGEVDLELAEPDRLKPPNRGGAPQHGLDACHDFRRCRGLDDVVIAAETEAADLVGVAIA